ncbi:calcium-translocating P-type ATPase [Saccharothrix ecbatanensis]|uniref:Calcium-translocating P-type ATPase n=1 Tax=Saccharothrix ecbatanensis TaxID=1105145 RepID=A0A7W9HI76_9PSEU|nr:cation-transporting P-type ATPase [Saccharothrix ecbatanensis]MBB5802680.1 calcium-translocating P-type ATPase [Saccharothrix ecbatanensis]
MELLGIDPVRVAGGLAKGLIGLALAPLEQTALRQDRRKVWSCPGRLYIEAHGVHGPRGKQVSERIERALESHPGVLWARVNAPSARVIVAVEGKPPTSELVALVRRAEAEPATEDERLVEDELHHPADGLQGTRLLPALAADVAGLALAAITKIAPWAPLPGELAALIAAVDLHPKLRELAAGRLQGRERADTATSIAAALVQGLASRSESTLLDIAQRVQQWREVKAHEEAWCAAEGDLIDGPDDAVAEPVVVERPLPFPEGPVDRYARRALAAGAAAGLAAVPFTGPRRAAALGVASLPKAPFVGRAAFAAQLGRVLAGRGALVMERSVLRRLDAMDVLVLDETALGSGRSVLVDLVPLPDTEPAEAAERAFALFDPKDPTSVRRDGDWAIGPVDHLGLQGRKGVREQRRLSDHAAVLGLSKGHRLQAVLAVDVETNPAVDAIAAAARDAGLRVVVATDRERTPVRFADSRVPSGKGLVGAVRELQGQGHVVLLVSDNRRALGTADCGVGVHRDGGPPPWGAHVVVRDLEGAVLLAEAVPAARRVDRDGIMLAQAASGIGAVSALSTRGPRPSRGAARAVDGASAIAFVDGVWRAKRLTGNGAAPVAAGTSQPWHLMPAATVLDRLGSGRDGLADGEAQRRQRTSTGRQAVGTSLGSAFLAELANPLTPVLAGGAAVSAAVGSPVDAALVAGVVGVSALIGSVQQVATDRALATLLSRSAVRATVVREGRDHEVTADALVVGDVVRLVTGDVVPADCRLLDGDGLEADESSVTGESLPVAKDPAPVVAAELADRSSMLYEGTTIAAGEALAVVVATGDATEVGRSMAAARRNIPTTGVEARLADLTRKIMPVALGSAAAVTGAGLLRGVPLRQSMGAAVNLAVASVPEGLPFLVNAAQLAAARRLAEHGALVRNPSTIEALGRVDVLCFDKTGTLTEGRLAVSRVDNGRRAAPLDQLNDELRRVMAAAVRATPPADDPDDLAHQTDRAVLAGARRARIRPTTGARGWSLVEALPFEPSRGYHATVGKVGKQSVLSVKGAPEVVLPRCDVDPRGLKRLEERVRRLAGRGHRVLAVAERTGFENGAAKNGAAIVTDDDVQGLSLLGFVALSDPVRDAAPPAAAKLREAGVRIVMITGDHPATGEAIAAEVSGSGADMTVVTGSRLDRLDDGELDALLPTVDVIARCTPSQKVRIIEAYQRLGRVVAMTGDGANDAPAIRLADVGIALGRRGTPAARAAADLVVTDDRLETIIAALIEGRAMWASVREALAVLLGGNIGEIAFSVLGSALTGRSPLTARQLLLVNLLTDLAPALAIALSRPARESVPELLREGPTSSLGSALNRDITARAITTALGATAAWTAARLTGRSRRAGTVALAALVGTQLGQTLVTGGLDRSVLAAGLGSFAALGAVIQTPGVSQFFGCTPLGPIGWGIALSSATAANLLGLAITPLVEATAIREE